MRDSAGNTQRAPWLLVRAGARAISAWVRAAGWLAGIQTKREPREIGERRSLGRQEIVPRVTNGAVGWGIKHWELDPSLLFPLLSSLCAAACGVARRAAAFVSPSLFPPLCVDLFAQPVSRSGAHSLARSSPCVCVCVCVLGTLVVVASSPRSFSTSVPRMAAWVVALLVACALAAAVCAEGVATPSFTGTWTDTRRFNNSLYLCTPTATTLYGSYSNFGVMVGGLKNFRTVEGRWYVCVCVSPCGSSCQCLLAPRKLTRE